MAKKKLPACRRHLRPAECHTCRWSCRGGRQSLRRIHARQCL